MSKQFFGLNNVTDRLRLGVQTLVTADNVDISDTGALAKRAGYVQAQPCTPSTVYSTLDYSRMYLVDAGVLKVMHRPGDLTVLQTGLSSAPLFWTEINGQVFFNNGVNTGIINPDHSVLPWSWDVPASPTLRAVSGNLPAGLYRAACTYVLPDGRETGADLASEITLTGGQALQISGIPQTPGLTTRLYIAPADSTVLQLAGSPSATALVWNDTPDALGADLLTSLMNPVPDGADVIQAWRGSLYCALYMPASDQTAVFFSQPLGFHLFDLVADFFLVPGRVRMLAPHKDALIVGTERRIHAFDGERLTELAAYGVVPGMHWASDDERVIFWSQRGACAALPFTNLTERQVSVAPGTQAGAAIVRHGGQKRYVVALKQGGSAFNPFS
jgi:hypothetical protein